MKINEVRHLLTYNCNLNCKHCYLDAGSRAECQTGIKEFSQEDLDKFYQHYQPEVVSATGGEPLLRPDMVFKLAKSVGSYGGSLEVVTNGYLLNQEIIEKLKEVNPNVFFQISLDGQKEYHNWLRQDENAYDAALNAIKLAAENGCKTKVRLTATNENIGQIPSIIETLDRFEQDNINLVIRPVVSKGRAQENNLSMDMDYSELDPLNMIPEHISVETTDNMGKCGCGVNTVAIDPEGNIFPCTYFTFNKEYKMGTLTEDPGLLGEQEEFKNYEGTCYARHMRGF